MVKSVKQLDSVIVWECFSGNGRHGGIYFLPKYETMNLVRDPLVLSDHLLDWMDSYGFTHFFLDGAPCPSYASNMIKFFLDKPSFEVMHWTGNSPDLNPIKNLRNQMKNKLKMWASLPTQSKGHPVEAVDSGPQQRLSGRPQCLDVQEDCCHHQEWRIHEKINWFHLLEVFPEKYLFLKRVIQQLKPILYQTWPNFF